MATAAQREACHRPSPASCKEAAVSQQWMWILPAPLLLNGNRKLEAALLQRVKQAESGEWMQLLRQFRDRMDQNKRRDETPGPTRHGGQGSSSNADQYRTWQLREAFGERTVRQKRDRSSPWK